MFAGPAGSVSNVFVCSIVCVVAWLYFNGVSGLSMHNVMVYEQQSILLMKLTYLVILIKNIF